MERGITSKLNQKTKCGLAYALAEICFEKGEERV
jgi:hypothetical protein